MSRAVPIMPAKPLTPMVGGAADGLRFQGLQDVIPSAAMDLIRYRRKCLIMAGVFGAMAIGRGPNAKHRRRDIDPARPLTRIRNHTANNGQKTKLFDGPIHGQGKVVCLAVFNRANLGNKLLLVIDKISDRRDFGIFIVGGEHGIVCA